MSRYKEIKTSSHLFDGFRFHYNSGECKCPNPFMEEYIVNDLNGYFNNPKGSGVHEYHAVMLWIGLSRIYLGNYYLTKRMVNAGIIGYLTENPELCPIEGLMSSESYGVDDPSVSAMIDNDDNKRIALLYETVKKSLFEKVLDKVESIKMNITEKTIRFTVVTCMGILSLVFNIVDCLYKTITFIVEAIHSGADYLLDKITYQVKAAS